MLLYACPPELCHFLMKRVMSWPLIVVFSLVLSEEKQLTVGGTLLCFHLFIQLSRGFLSFDYSGQDRLVPEMEFIQRELISSFQLEIFGFSRHKESEYACLSQIALCLFSFLFYPALFSPSLLSLSFLSSSLCP